MFISCQEEKWKHKEKVEIWFLKYKNKTLQRNQARQWGVMDKGGGGHSEKSYLGKVAREGGWGLTGGHGNKRVDKVFGWRMEQGNICQRQQQ